MVRDVSYRDLNVQHVELLTPPSHICGLLISLLRSFCLLHFIFINILPSVLKYTNQCFVLSLCSSRLKGAWMVGRNSGRPNRTDTRKLCGVFIAQGLQRELDWIELDLTAQNWTDSVRFISYRTWLLWMRWLLSLTGKWNWTKQNHIKWIVDWREKEASNCTGKKIQDKSVIGLVWTASKVLV